MEVAGTDRAAFGDLPVGPGSTVLVVCAHPDDESFGLGAIIAAMVEAGAHVQALCLTHGEASTLGVEPGADLGTIRAHELTEAARVLGIGRTTLRPHPDGGLEQVAAATLLADVEAAAAPAMPDLLLVFDPSGITGHPDHRRATDVALRFAEAHDIPVLAWTLPEGVAARLNGETGASFLGSDPDEIDITIPVDRRRQWEAIACHRSQERDNPVLRARLRILGDREHLRWLR